MKDGGCQPAVRGTCHLASTSGDRFPLVGCFIEVENVELRTGRDGDTLCQIPSTLHKLVFDVRRRRDEASFQTIPTT
jgi:hypothetical protein